MRQLRCTTRGGVRAGKAMRYSAPLRSREPRKKRFVTGNLDGTPPSNVLEFRLFERKKERRWIAGGVGCVGCVGVGVRVRVRWVGEEDERRAITVQSLLRASQTALGRAGWKSLPPISDNSLPTTDAVTSSASPWSARQHKENNTHPVERSRVWDGHALREDGVEGGGRCGQKTSQRHYHDAITASSTY